jgi:hypothetical protein
MSSQPSSGLPPSRDPSEGRRLGLVGLLIELLLPTLLSATLLLVLAGYTSYWDLRTRLGLAVFGVLLVALSAAASLQLDALTRTRRRRRGKSQLLNRAGARWRLTKLVLGGVVIPIGCLVSANAVELPGHRTPLSLAIELRLPKPQLSREQELGHAILRAQSSAARVQGILALKAMKSDAALEQLLRLLADDPAALTRGGEYEALSGALASFGVRAKAPLLQRLRAASPRQRAVATAPPQDVFERYFADDFAQLQHEVEQDPRAAQAGVRERLQGAEADLKQVLRQVAVDSGEPRGERDIPAFVMRTFLAMDLKQEAELLLFARQCAADPAWSDPVRGQALLLVAKLGGKDDLDGLFARLGDPSALLQLRALQAIVRLQAKLASEASSG